MFIRGVFLCTKPRQFRIFVIMLMETRFGEVLQRTLLLDEAQAWFDSITPGLKAKTIRDWIQEDQLFDKGIDETGEILGRYSKTTEELSNGEKTAGTPYTLKDSGQFYRSMFIRTLTDSIVIDADFNKMSGEKWFVENGLNESKILGLTDENLEKFIAEIAVNYSDYVRRVLGVD